MSLLCHKNEDELLQQPNRLPDHFIIQLHSQSCAYLDTSHLWRYCRDQTFATAEKCSPQPNFLNSPFDSSDSI